MKSKLCKWKCKNWNKCNKRLPQDYKKIRKFNKNYNKQLEKLVKWNLKILLVKLKQLEVNQLHQDKHFNLKTVSIYKDIC